ncbi:MAG: hypothetical protein ACXVPN_02695 [Bacteroidia bacterium]
MAEETQYSLNAAVAQISTANTNLDGTGTLGTLITAGAGGTLLGRVFIKALGNTTRGMIRFFINGNGTTRLLKEVDVFPVTKSSVNPSFEATFNFDFLLKEGYILKVSTNNAETFNVIVGGYNFAYYASSVREDTTQFHFNTGRTTISTANPNLDGTGTIGTAFTAGNVAYSTSGSGIGTITIKGTVTTTPGMVRLFFIAGANKFLFTEIPVPARTPDATDQAFEHTLEYEDDLDVSNGIGIGASTENAQNFDIMVESKDWNYAA